MVTQENIGNEKVKSSEEETAEEVSPQVEGSTDSDDKAGDEEASENSAD